MTIINELVLNAAYVMEAKAEFNEMVAARMVTNGKPESAERLRHQNKRIADAVALIRETAGCWA